MRWVPAAVVRPHRCACIPFIGSHDAGGFFDFNTEIAAFDGHVYVSVVAARQMAEYMGWVPRDQRDREKDALRGEIEALNAKAAELEGRVAAQSEELAAVHVLKRGGFGSSAKPGRPPKAKAVA